MNEFTEGICGDGVCVMREGRPIDISTVLKELNRLQALIDRAKESEEILYKFYTEEITEEDVCKFVYNKLKNI